MSNLSYNGFLIHRIQESQKNRLVCLTDMWRAEGSPDSKEVNDWLRTDKACCLLLQLVSEISPELKLVCDRVLESKPEAGSGRSAKDKQKFRVWALQVKQVAVQAGLLVAKSGKGGGTYATSKVAIAYAEDLSPAFHSWALTAIEQRIEEEADPEKALSRGYERAVRGWRRQGYSDADIELLTQSVITRKDLTGTLADHGVEQGVPAWTKDNPKAAYGIVTNELYKPLLPGTAGDYRKKHNLPKKANVRAHLTEQGQLTKRAAIMLAETMARETIKDEERYGFNQCKDACGQAGKKVARVFEP